MSDSALRQFYQLRTLDPTDYLADSIDPIDFEYDEDLNTQYELLQKLIDSNNVQQTSSTLGDRKDDVEPLGLNDSMVEELLERDVIEDSRDEAKHKYFISDESFDVKLYMLIQQGRPRKQLFSRLELLDNEIAMRQGSLNDVLHTEFVRFINIKNSLGDTMDRFNRERDLQNFDDLGLNLKRASQETNNVLSPLVNAKNKESMIMLLLNFINEHKFIFNLPHDLQNDISTKNYDSLIYDYNKGKYQYSKVMASVKTEEISESNLLLLDRVWKEVEITIEGYKKLIWEKLNNIDIDELNTSSYNISININNDHNYIALIYKLLELNVEDNPIISFIDIQYFKIESEIEDIFNSYSKNITLLQRSILDTYNLESTSSLSFLIQMLKDGNVMSDSELIADLPLVLELWKLIRQFISNFTSLVNKLVKFSSLVDFVINGYFLEQHNDYVLQKRGTDYQVGKSIESHLKFDRYQIKKIKEQNEKLVLKICENLIEFFTKSAADFQNSELSQYYTKEEIKNTPFEFGFLPPFTNAITASIENLLIYKIISDDFEKLANSNTIISRAPTVVNALSATCVNVNKALQTSVIYLLINDMKYSYMLNLDKDTDLIELIELYYSLFVRKLSLLVFQQDITNRFKIKPSEGLFEGFETSFLRSLNYFIEANLKRNLIEDNEKSKYKTLLNFYRLKNEMNPNILANYDQFFKSNLSQQRLKIFDILDSLELEIFENLTAPITLKITTIFNSNHDNLSVKAPNSVSRTMKEIIAVLVTTKVECLRLSLPDFLIHKVLSKLIHQTFIKSQDFIKSNDNNLEQILTDLKFFEYYFDDYIKRNEHAVKLIDKIYGILGNKLNLRQISSKIDVIVEQAIQDSKIELN